MMYFRLETPNICFASRYSKISESFTLELLTYMHCELKLVYAKLD